MCGTVLYSATARAQDMEPRSYANTPVNLNMIVLGYTHSWGAVVLNSSLPVADLNVNLNALAPAYVRTFPVFGWASKLIVTWPYVTLSGDGTLQGDPISREMKGVADPRVRLNVNFFGAPALTLSEFMKYEQRTIVGVTFEVQAPLGSYDVTKVVNIGANRWTFMAEAGLSRRVSRWTLEAALGGIVFTDNDEYLDTSTVSQDPVVYSDFHVIYSIKPAIWVALDALWVWGGQTTVDGTERADLQTDTRVGLSFSFPIARRHSLKFLYTNGVTTRFGADFQTVGVSWVMNWGG